MSVLVAPPCKLPVNFIRQIELGRVVDRLMDSQIAYNAASTLCPILATDQWTRRENKLLRYLRLT